ncbi:MAG TPA: phage holin family protein [Geminicoccaceae bacterium]|nr:phage holin family protein [Geminicoccaceae bacterium]
MSRALGAPLLRGILQSRAARDLRAHLVGYAVALVLLASAFGFLVATLYLALAEVVEPPLAALLTSLLLGLIAGLILLTLRMRRRRIPTATIGVEGLLLSATDQVRRDPWSSLLIAAVLGALAEITRPSSSRPPS